MHSWWERLVGRRSAPAPAAANDGIDALLEELRDHIRGAVAAGFDDERTIIESAVADYEGEADPAFLADQARRMAAEALAVHRDEQSRWPARTDCDRLDAAFAALERSGIVARQHFTCCGTCGLAGIEAEIAAAEATGARVRGYTFYHWQDTEAAVEGRGVFLYYGSVEADKAAALAIAREIVAELERHGLCPQWNGSWDRRIELPLDWKRRRAA